MKFTRKESTKGRCGHHSICCGAAAILCVAGLVVLFDYSAEDAGGISRQAPAIHADCGELLSAPSIEEARVRMGQARELARPTAASRLEGGEDIQELPLSEQKSLWAAFSEGRRMIYPIQERYRDLENNKGAHFYTQNPQNQIVARFLGDGVRFQSGWAGREWQGTIRLEGSLPLEIRQQGTQIEYAHENFLEWYANHPEGIQHGFTVAKRPANAHNGVLDLRLAVEGLRVEKLDGRDEGSSDLQFVNAAGEPVLAYSGILAWDANGRELGATMESTSTGLEILVADMDAVYPVTIDPLITSLETKLGPEITGSKPSAGDKFGYSVSMDGDTAVIGAFLDHTEAGTSAGSANVFVRQGSNWIWQAQLLAEDAAAGDNLGSSVSLEGDTALVGAQRDVDAGSDSGSAYVFVRSGTSWSQEAKLVAGDAGSGDYFGVSVSLDADTALVGAHLDDDGSSSSGSAYVFVRSGNSWSQQAKLLAADAHQSALLGYSVSLDGDTALVGAFGGGAAYIFVRDGTTWSEQAKLLAGDAASGDYFGRSVSLDGDTALIGADREDEGGGDSGAAYIFVRSGTSWNQEAKLVAGDSGNSNYFGYSVSVDGDMALIGAYQGESAGYTSPGAAYVFVRNDTSWDEQAKLTAEEPGSRDRFGNSVCLNGDTAIIGGPDNNNYASDSGSAYIFVRNQTEWSQQSILHIGDTAEGDQFGSAVSVDGDTALIGARYDDTDAGRDAGTAYVLIRSGGSWSQQARLEADDSAQDDSFGHSVSLSGDTALVGARSDDTAAGSNAGSAYVFVRNETIWSEEAKLEAGDAAEGDQFGQSVSLNSDTALVGAHLDDTAAGNDAGSAYIFVRSGAVWSEQAKLEGSDSTSDTWFGYSVSMDGDTALVGAYLGDTSAGADAGSAYVFVRSGTLWNQEAKLEAGDAEANDRFGFSVSLDGDTALVGAFADDTAAGSDAGSAYVYVRSGSIWSEEARLESEDGAEGDRFGISVSIDGDSALVGAVGDDNGGSYSGSAYVFTRGGTNWSQKVRVNAGDAHADDAFGWSVSLDGDIALVSAYTDDGLDNAAGTAGDQGSVYIFRLSQTGSSSDGDEVSDEWEMANGFDIHVEHDHLTKDSDHDGTTDLWEIFQGTDKTISGDGYGLREVAADIVNKSLSTRYRRSTASTGVVRSYRWSENLVDWHPGGTEIDGIQINFSSQVVESGAGYEIIELTAEVVSGEVERLFLKVELIPVG